MILSEDSQPLSFVDASARLLVPVTCDKKKG